MANTRKCQVCGKVGSWESLKLIGVQVTEDEEFTYQMELRNCACGATLAGPEIAVPKTANAT